MPVYKNNSSAAIVPFMPIDNIELNKFKAHLEYLFSVEKDIDDFLELLFHHFVIFKTEFKGYFKMKENYKYAIDVAHDMDSIIYCLDTFDFADRRVKDAKEYVRNRINTIIAIACVRAKEELNLSYEETLQQLNLEPELSQEIIDKIKENN